MMQTQTWLGAVNSFARVMPKSFWLVTGLYLFVNILLVLLASPGANLAQGGDAGSYWNPALALLKYGGFVQLENPTEPNFYRTPFYPLMISGLMSIFGESPDAVIFMQLILLYISGLIFRNSVRDWLPGWENLGLALIVLNPNLLGTAHLIQSETLYLFFMSIAFWALLMIVREDFRWSNALIIGSALAAACLVKPTSQFLIPLLPIALPLIAVAAGVRAKWGRLFVQGLLALVLALAIMAPWASKLADAGNGYSLSEHSIRYRFLWDQVVMLEANKHGLSYHEAEKQTTAPGSYHASVIESYGGRWKELSKVEQFAILERHGYQAILSYPIALITKVMVQSVAQFMVSGGAGNLHNLLGIDTARLNRVWFKTSQQDIGGMLTAFFGKAPLTALAISSVSLGFAVIARLIGLAGFVSMMRRGEYALILVLVGLIGYFVAVHLFHGNSRYRIPVEPAMMLFVLYGLREISVWLRNWRQRKGTAVAK
jgi:4-amino-4-deoxy-L-arabinose transferase-like glycosyltransferase